MTNPEDLIKEEIATLEEQLKIDVKKLKKYKKKHKKLLMKSKYKLIMQHSLF